MSVPSRTSPQLLTSAMVYIRDYKNELVKYRALLDTCATVNFISERAIKRLRIPVTAQSTAIGAINTMSTVSRGVVHITIYSINDEFHRDLTCLTIPAISDLIPSESFPRNSISIPPNVKLADPKFHLPQSVDLLIGSGATLSLFCIGQINLSREGVDLYLQKTRLGWVVAGGAIAQTTHRGRGTCHLTKLEKQVEMFWTVEEVATNKLNPIKENKCEEHFLRTVSRDDRGRYIVRLPFGDTNKCLGESRTIAYKRLLALERKFNVDTALKDAYTQIIDDYLRLNYLSVIKKPEGDGYYMPHHAVIKNSSNTTKVRIVFDASAKTNNGVSLNDVLLVGPTIQDKLFTHLVRFRTYKYVITADIEKMYLQILIHDDDRRYQRILWRKDGEIKTLQFNTLTFGVSSSPFLAIRALQKLADDEGGAFPRAAKILKEHLYVDDLLSGANDIDEARTIRDELIALLKRGGITIRQWAANDERIVNDLATNALHANLVFDKDCRLTALGVAWFARDDEIRYSTRGIKISERVTKRNILSEIAKIFDPLGLLGPIVLHAKRLMQDAWRCQTKWDESVPQAMHTAWSEYVQQLDLINQISFDRRVLIGEGRDLHLHGFCDASNVGYGACIYVRSIEDGNRNAIVKLLCAKSRVAPLKTVTIPRLELCGALLLSRLHREVIYALDRTSVRTTLWCDSMVVLHWLRMSPHSLNTFVANRVSEIQTLTESNQWRYVRTKDNPADALSRGQLPRSFLRNRQWFTGPEWLIRDESEWPDEAARSIEVPEIKKNVCLITALAEPEVFERYSSYSKLLRILAYCRRFRPNNKYAGKLCINEIDETEIQVLKIIQATRFNNEIEELRKTKSITRGKIANLSPFLDENELLRVGGRLQKSDLPFSRRHPILLPNRHRVTDRIIREIHDKHYHTGIQSTLYILRQRYWVIDGRNQVRKIVNTCVRCARFNAVPVKHKMGNLPSARVRESIPFANTGVDFCGPFFIKERKYRNRARVKVYICVFICMTVKAVHLEIVSDLTTDGFLAALRRFTARRGLPENIYSDNGTNFVGANSQLKEMYACLNSEDHKDAVNAFAIEHRITWHFMPPAAPHFGGLWESTVKLFKHHFKRVVGESLFTFEQLNTFAIEVEGILNSRPITSLSSDPNDLLVLTPAHYLIGKPLTTLPEGNLLQIPVNRLSAWQHITKIRQDFWARWHLEYLNELQTRNKWIKNGPSLSIGAVVIIRDKNLPCTQWALGKVLQIHPGEDGIVRSVTVKTKNGNIKRAAKCLCPLPVEQ